MYSTDSFSLGIVPPLLNIHWLKIHVGLFLLLTPFSMLCCGPQMRSMPLTTCLKNLIGWAGCCLYPSGFICQWSHAIMSVSNHASNAGISKHWVGALSAHTRGWKDSLSPAFVCYRESWQLFYATWWLTCILRAVIWLKPGSFDLNVLIRSQGKNRNRSPMVCFEAFFKAAATFHCYM